ncbi:MAG: TerB family tellurite resistance protein [Gemmatimonadetes bacterium]|nr:TerB family tellurite resistance protein [Gemmatimonadota bacterium]
MRESIRQFFAERMAPTNGEPHGKAQARLDAEDERQRLHVAACALLLEIAHADDTFSESEQLHIEAVMRRHFDLDEETAVALIELAEAERSKAIDLYQFTSLIRDNYDLGQKTLLAEIMWGLILTDGEVQRHEGYMLRKIANLLDLEAGYLSTARKRAAARLD